MLILNLIIQGQLDDFFTNPNRPGLGLQDRQSLEPTKPLTTNTMAEYSELIQAYDPDMHLLLILTPQIVELIYTAKSAINPQDLNALDLWVDQYLSQHVSHANIPFRAHLIHYTLPRDHGQTIG